MRKRETNFRSLSVSGNLIKDVEKDLDRLYFQSPQDNSEPCPVDKYVPSGIPPLTGILHFPTATYHAEVRE